MSGEPRTTCAACGGRRSTAGDLILAEEEAREKEGAIWLEKFFGPTIPAERFAADWELEQFMQDPALRVYERKELCVACWRGQEGLDERKEPEEEDFEDWSEDEDFEDWPEDEDEDALDEES